MRIALSILLLAFITGCKEASESSSSLDLTKVSAPGETSSGETANTETPSDKPSSAKDTAVNGQTEQKPAFDTVERTDAEWKAMLSDEEYRILREKGTERGFTGEYDHHFEKGAYACAGCGLVLFESDTKFNSGCGWPAFYASKAEDRVKLTRDVSLGMIRTEVTCARCNGHLGHIFDDAPQTPTGQRYCINSVSLKFIPDGKVEKGTTVVDLETLEEKAE